MFYCLTNNNTQSSNMTILYRNWIAGCSGPVWLRVSDGSRLYLEINSFLSLKLHVIHWSHYNVSVDGRIFSILKKLVLIYFDTTNSCVFKADRHLISCEDLGRIIQLYLKWAVYWGRWTTKRDIDLHWYDLIFAFIHADWGQVDLQQHDITRKIITTVHFI